MENIWYRSSYHFISILLMPIAWIFSVLVTCRRFLYRAHCKKSYSFSVPVIVVGNITVGGTGKTPFVIWLANYLKTQGFRPGIVSRGVGGQQQRQPRWVKPGSSPQEVGDEAMLLSQHAPLVISKNRVAAVKELLAKTDCNIVISDDGLQHYRLRRDIEIAIVDGARGLGNQCFLPAGPLRESPRRLQEVDFVIENSNSLSQKNRYAMKLQGDELISINNAQQKIPLRHFQNQTVHAVAAIGNPERFFSSLENRGIKIIRHRFPDHYLYQAKDLNFGDALPIIMTEKDAVKYRHFAQENAWYLPVSLELTPEFINEFSLRVKKFIHC